MPDCHDFCEDLTAWIDGELPEQRCGQVRRHLAGCTLCSAEVESLRTTVVWQRRALRAVTAVDAVDAGALAVRLRRDLAMEGEEERPVWGWGLRDVWASMWGRLALAGAAVSVAGAVMVLAGGPGMVLMPLGLESPPPAVVQHTELFREYPLIERLDVLEHFDTVESMPLDDESAAQRG